MSDVTYDCFISGLSPDLSSDKLRAAFQDTDGLQSIYTPKDQKGPLNIAFAKYNSDQNSIKAVELMNGKMIHGKLINVKRTDKNRLRAGSGVQGSGDASHNKPDLVSYPHAKHVSNSQSKSPTEAVIVTHVEPPLKIFLQHYGNMTQINDLARSLQSICVSMQPLQGMPIEKKIYGTRFSEDGMWYRCKVLKSFERGEFLMFFIDFGNVERKLSGELVELPHSLQSIQPFASACLLYGVKPKEGDDDFKSKCCVHFLELTTAKNISAEFISLGPKGGPVHLLPIILFREDGMDINQEMLNAGFVERRFNQPPKLDMKFNPQAGLQTMGSLLAAKENSPNRPMPQPLLSMNTSANHRVNQTSQNDNISATLKSLSESAFSWVGGGPNAPNVISGAAPSVQNKSHAEAGAKLQSATNEINRLRNELDNLRRNTQQTQTRSATNDVHKLRLELDHVKQQSQQQLQTYQKEKDHLTSKLSSAKAECHMLQNSIDENFMSSKMDTLITSVQSVKKLRQQFPSCGQSLDVIDRCLILLGKEESCIKVDSIDHITAVRSAQDSYNCLQNQIKQLTELDNDLIVKRDEARQQLDLRITEFLQYVSEVPLTSRADELHCSIKHLMASYNTFLNSKIEDTLPHNEVALLYHDWKKSKEALFDKIRTDTNTDYDKVNCSLRLLQQQFCLIGFFSSENISDSSTLGPLLNSFQNALSAEIKHTDMAHSLDDVSKLQLIVQSLKKCLDAEKDEIRQVQSLKEEYTLLKQIIAPWLNEKPSLLHVLNIRKTIKTLKSKLRHKLADKVDLEEDCDTSEEDFHILNKEISQQRSDLQHAFTKEEGILTDLGDVTEKHFPELIMENPNFSLDRSNTYGGLIKIGRTLDHFDLSPLGKLNLQLSTFCDQPVVIKEYLLDDLAGIKKSDVLRRAAAYYDVQGQHAEILSIQGTFFSHNERHMYLQLPYYKHNLASYIAQASMSPEQQFVVVRNLLSAITALHSARLVHGAIHPANIFLTEDGRAVLAEYDFTKSLDQRADKSFITTYGLSFKAPECNTSVSKATDMYNMGLVAYWLHNPEATGLADFYKTPESASLEWFLNFMLNPDASKRLSAPEAADLPYFKESPHLKHPTMPTTACENEPSELKFDESLNLSKDNSKDATKNKESLHDSPGKTYVSNNVLDLLNEQDALNYSGDAQSISMYDEGTPLPCTPMGTPVNTPIDGINTQASGKVKHLMNCAVNQLAAQHNGNQSDDCVAEPVMSSQQVVDLAKQDDDDDDISDID